MSHLWRKTHLIFSSTIIAACVILRSHALSMPARTIEPDDEARRVQSNQYNELLSLFPSLETMKATPNATIHVSMTNEEKLHIRNSNDFVTRLPIQPAIEGVTKLPTLISGKFTHNTTGSHGGFTNGFYNATANGFIWSAILESDDAVGIDVVLKNATIPNGVQVHLFNYDGHYDMHVQKRVYQGEIYFKTLPGHFAILGLIYTGNETEKAKEELLFCVAEVGVTNPYPVLSTDDPFTTRRNLQNCGWSIAPCVKDYQCCDPIVTTDNDCKGVESQDEEFRDKYMEELGNSVAKMRWYEGKYRYSCTASLINNADGRVLLMTANHCVSTSKQNLQLYFSERSDTCGPSCDFILGVADTIGMTVLATSRMTDFTLFESNQALPTSNGKTFTALGWSSDPVAVGDRQYRIHHPRRGPQSYSEQIVASITIEPDFIFSRPRIGETMPGSSGSPIVDERNRFRGQHYGWNRAQADYCSADGQYDNYYTIDGAFSTTYPMIADILGDVTDSPTPELSGVPSISPPCSDSKVYTFGSYTWSNGNTVVRDCAWITNIPSKLLTRQDRWCNEVVEGSLVKDECPDACEECPSPSPSNEPSVAPTNKLTLINCEDSTIYTFGSYTLQNGETIVRDCAWITNNPSKLLTRQDRWCNEGVEGSLVKDECPDACGACNQLTAPSVAPTNTLTIINCEDSTVYTFGSYTLQNGETIVRDCAWITKNPPKLLSRQDRWCELIVGGSLVKDKCPNACGACNHSSSSPAPSVAPTYKLTLIYRCEDSTVYTFGSYTTKNGETIVRDCAWITKNPPKLLKRQDRWCDLIFGGVLVQDECPAACGQPCEEQNDQVRIFLANGLK